jgi:hypothetical protein
MALSWDVDSGESTDSDPRLIWVTVEFEFYEGAIEDDLEELVDDVARRVLRDIHPTPASAE